MKNNFYVHQDLDTHLKNICRLIFRNHDVLNIDDCHARLNEHYARFRNNKNFATQTDKKTKEDIEALILCRMDHEMRIMWDNLIYHKDDLIETIRGKNEIIEKQNKIILEYEKNKINIVTTMEEKEIQTDPIIYQICTYNEKEEKPITKKEKKDNEKEIENKCDTNISSLWKNQLVTNDEKQKKKIMMQFRHVLLLKKQ